MMPNPSSVIQRREPRFRTPEQYRAGRAATQAQRRRLTPEYRSLREIVAAARRARADDGGRTWIVALIPDGQQHAFTLPEGQS